MTVHDRVATYRLQIHKDFTLDAATKTLPFLKDLGISDIYLSPVFEAAEGSNHGYDVADFTKIGAERGGQQAFDALHAVCAAEGLRMILDIVPNHMGLAGENPFWFDVLARGEDSQYWTLFDLRIGEDGKIHLPLLEKPLADMISDGKIQRFTHTAYGAGITISGRYLPVSAKTVHISDLEELIDAQQYKPVVWTESFDKITYRRFFDITDLIGVRVEDPNVYEVSHHFILKLLKSYPSVAGLRVDHIDGLADPAAYLSMLSKDADNIWVEKILSEDEHVPSEWPVLGTTGYEFISKLNNLLVDPAGFEKLRQYWVQNIDNRWQTFGECVLDSKEDIIGLLFPSELKRLVRLSSDIADEQQAEIFWRGMTVALGVYRTYAGELPLSEVDRENIQKASAIARKRYGAPFVAAEKIFMPMLLHPKTDTDRKLVQEWQQLSGPAMAKGLEDCAHYRYNPLAALNEVGCEASVAHAGHDQFFQWMQERAHAYPQSLLATSTHDTKRSEDARQRLYALADRPDDWIAFFEQSVRINARLKNHPIRPATEYFLYQTILCVWPFDDRLDDDFIPRIQAYMKKSIKEARQETSWLDPEEEYEQSLSDFIEAILKNVEFLRHMASFAREIMAAGAVNSLSALTLKILGCGVPDFYQGADGWDFSLVDPDNRRPVDFESHADSLSRRDDYTLSTMVANWRSPAIKIWLTHALLKIRGAHLESTPAIKPLTVVGEDNTSVVAYKWNGLIVACRRYAGRQSGDSIAHALDATIGVSGRTYNNLLTGESLHTEGHISVGRMFGQFPVVVLKEEEDS